MTGWRPTCIRVGGSLSASTRPRSSSFDLFGPVSQGLRFPFIENKLVCVGGREEEVTWRNGNVLSGSHAISWSIFTYNSWAGALIGYFIYFIQFYGYFILLVDIYQMALVTSEDTIGNFCLPSQIKPFYEKEGNRTSERVSSHEIE